MISFALVWWQLFFSFHQAYPYTFTLIDIHMSKHIFRNQYHRIIEKINKLNTWIHQMTYTCWNESNKFIESHTSFWKYPFCHEIMQKQKLHKQEMFQKHISPPLVQNSKLLLVCTRYYEFRTLYKAELNIIKYE